MSYLSALNVWMLCRKVVIPRWLRDVGLVLAVLIFGLFLFYMGRMAVQVNNVIRVQSVQHTLFRYYMGLSNVESGQRGYLLSGDDRCLKQYYEAKAATLEQMDTLKTYNFSEREQKIVDTLLVDSEHKLAEMESTIVAFKSHGQADALTIFRTGIGIELKAKIQKEVWVLLEIEKNHATDTLD